MTVPEEQPPAERTEKLEQVIDALQFAAETVNDVMPQPQASGFEAMAAELQKRAKRWRDGIHNAANE